MRSDLLAALAQEALELACEHVAGRELGEVGRPLLLVGVTVDAGDLETAASEYERQVDVAVQSDPDVQAFVERLELASAEDPGPTQQDVPSGDVLAREFQRFLRQRGQ